MEDLCKKYFSLLDKTWQEVLEDEFKESYFLDLLTFLEQEKRLKNIFPPQETLFTAFNETPYDKVKVVIMGQDPYHGKGQAHGLSFSVADGVKQPPSLKNIFQELATDLNREKPVSGSLLSWARQGVLLLNATLTVREKEPQSHYGMGWERFTNGVIKKLVCKENPIIFVLWGKAAQEKCGQFLHAKDREIHKVLTAPHPSPYSASSGFFGCRHFSKINAFLEQNGLLPIQW